jgi:hypothetical protein
MNGFFSSLTANVFSSHPSHDAAARFRNARSQASVTSGMVTGVAMAT